jgi:HSP20 family protein
MTPKIDGKEVNAMAHKEELATRPEAGVTRRDRGGEYYVPAVDVSEKKNEMILRYDMPGVGKEDLEITVENNILTVIGKVGVESFGNAVYQETRIGNYRRQFALPDDVEADNINAEMKDGVLTVRIAKPEKAKPKKIQITSG